MSSPDDRSPSFDIKALRFTSVRTDDEKGELAGVDVTLELCGPAVQPDGGDRYQVEWGHNGFERAKGVCRQYLWLGSIPVLGSTERIPTARYESECHPKLPPAIGYYHLVMAELVIGRDVVIDGNAITWHLRPGLIATPYDGVVEGRLWAAPSAYTRTATGLVGPVEANVPGSNDGVTLAPVADDAGPGIDFEVGTGAH